MNFSIHILFYIGKIAKFQLMCKQYESQQDVHFLLCFNGMAFAKPASICMNVHRIEYKPYILKKHFNIMYLSNAGLH